MRAADKKGSKTGDLNYPDGAHLLADGNVVVADIRNCRSSSLIRASSA